jgi:glycosyltransferase involved in cell wall biosynthesis
MNGVRACHPIEDDGRQIAARDRKEFELEDRLNARRCQIIVIGGSNTKILNSQYTSMRILLITDTHEARGGAEKVFFETKRILKEQGHTVFSLGFSDRTKQGTDYLEVREHPNVVIRQLFKLFFDPIAYRRIRRYVEDIKPDVIHIHNLNRHTPTLLKICQSYPTVHTAHDYFAVCPSMWCVHEDMRPCPTGLRINCWWRHRTNHSWPAYLFLLTLFHFRRKWMKYAIDAYIAPTPQLTEYLEINGFTPVTTIPHLLIANTKKVVPPKDTKHVLYVGVLEENKGVHILIEEFALALKIDPELVLTIAGSGDYKGKLERLTNRLGIDKEVRFLGWVTDIDTVYMNNSFIVVPSLCMESYGLVVIEAMLRGRVVIGSNRGGIPYLLKEGKIGHIIEPTEKGQIFEAIIKLSRSVTLADMGLRARHEITQNDR